jgi:hypothetical protein
MTTSTTRSIVPFTLKNGNAFELLTGFRLAAREAGCAQEVVMQTVVEAMSGDYEHLHATLAQWCLTEPMKGATK